tara:strand:+ start:1593 stop:2597 length:1005 start_codon:yes stop_codon:yes gene_type:complete
MQARLNTTTYNVPSWERCETYLKQNQPGTIKWLALMRDGQLEWEAKECSVDLNGVFSAKRSVHILIEMPPMPLATITRASWHERVKQLKKTYPALAVTGSPAAIKLMKLTPGISVQFDAAAGFVSSIGLNIAKYLEAETNGWDPALGRIVSVKAMKRSATATTATTTAVAAVAAVAAPAAVIVKRPKISHEAPGRRDPPTETAKLLRTAARCPPLIKYLKSERQFAHMNKGQWNCIRKWCETTDGVAWLKAAELDPLSFHLHHVKAYSVGGHFSVYNCVFAPGSANGWWGNLDSPHMREYIGDEAAKLSDRHAKWAAAQAAKGIDQGKFHPDFE